MKRIQMRQVLCLLLLMVGVLGKAETVTTAAEYTLKAVFLQKFLLFVEWPNGLFKSNDDPLIIGIFGKDPYGDNLKVLTNGQTVYGRRLEVKRFDKNTSSEELKQCHLLFLSSSSRPRMKQVLDELKNDPVLTVSEVKGFGQLGGMINFVVVKGNVKFEINKAAAENAGIKIRSKLLRLAIKIIGDKNAGEN